MSGLLRVLHAFSLFADRTIVSRTFRLDHDPTFIVKTCFLKLLDLNMQSFSTRFNTNTAVSSDMAQSQNHLLVSRLKSAQASAPPNCDIRLC